MHLFQQRQFNSFHLPFLKLSVFYLFFQIDRIRRYPEQFADTRGIHDRRFGGRTGPAVLQGGSEERQRTSAKGERALNMYTRVLPCSRLGFFCERFKELVLII